MKALLLALCTILTATAFSDESSFPPLDDKDACQKISDYFSKSFIAVRDREFVSLQRLSFSLYGAAQTKFYGWRDGDGVTHFPDGGSSKEKAMPEDFETLCHGILNPDSKQRKQEADNFFYMGLVANPSREQITPALAAIWLHRLGKGELAAAMWERALARQGEGRRAEADSEEEFLMTCGAESPWFLFNRAVSAHMYDEGEVALVSLGKLAEFYPKMLNKFGAGDRLLADLQRREKEGRFDDVSAKSPSEDFKKRSPEEQVAALIANLDQVNARQWGQPGGVSLANDWRVATLIQFGDPAVPALIDCFEKDDRLTKSVHYWRDFARSRTVLSVRETALTALMSILQVQLFEAGSTGDNYTSREDKKLQAMVKQLRDYWAENSKFDRPQRMMNAASDEALSLQERLQAVQTLAWHDHSFGISTMVFSNSSTKTGEFKKHPFIERFEKPTLAEVIWKIYLDLPKDENWEFCLAALRKVGDSRLAGVIGEHLKTEKNLHRRLALADTLASLGDPGPVNQIASRLHQGKRKYESSDLAACIEVFSKTEGEGCQQFLMGLAEPKHPHFRETLYGILDDGNFYSEQDFDQPSIDWLPHPFVLKILRDALTNETLTVATQKRESDDGVSYTTLRGGSGSSSGGRDLKAGECTTEEVTLRVCDLAAEQLSSFILDLPPYSPLLLKKNEALAKVRAAAKRELKELPGEFATHLNLKSDWPQLYLDPPTVIKKPATPEDVQAGRAAFSLEGDGFVHEMKLPAFGTQITTEPFEIKRPVVVLQAEKDAAGNLFYGVLTAYGFEKYPAEEITLPK